MPDPKPVPSRPETTRLRFAMPKRVPPGLWRRVPPAIFPPTLGLMGLALAWRQGINAFGLPQGLAGMLEGIAVALFLFCAVAYTGKLIRRPGVLRQELAILPGRAGTAAAVLCLYLLAALLTPYARGLAALVLILGFVVHVALLSVLIPVLIAAPPEGRRVTPVWHLNFAGFIVGALAAVGLGWTGLATAIFWLVLVIVPVIWGISLRQALHERIPAPLRPFLAIHAAPAALLGTVALGLNYQGIGIVLALFASALVLAGLVNLRWLTEAGFSPMWGAFTFPLAATAGLWMLVSQVFATEPLRIVAGLVLILATLVVLPIVFLIQREWATGRLPVKTNAAIA